MKKKNSRRKRFGSGTGVSVKSLTWKKWENWSTIVENSVEKKLNTEVRVGNLSWLELVVDETRNSVYLVESKQ